MRGIVLAQPCNQCGRQRFHEQALRYVTGDKNEYTVASIFVTIVCPGDSRLIKRILHYLIQAVTNRNLIPVSTAPIPEPFDVYNDYRAVYG